jgi:hypothetical protein
MYVREAVKHRMREEYFDIHLETYESSLWCRELVQCGTSSAGVYGERKVFLRIETRITE